MGWIEPEPEPEPEEELAEGEEGAEALSLEGAAPEVEADALEGAEATTEKAEV